MPELPEVETIRRQLSPQLVGTCIVRSWARLARRTMPDIPTFVSSTQNRRVMEARRHGKQLYFVLEDGHYLLIHLGMTGRLHLEPANGPLLHADLPRHVHAVFELDNGQRLVFTDPRTFGALAVTRDLHFLHKMGPEPFGDAFDETEVARRLRTRSTKIKAALLNQSLVAGLGNIYADEVCFLAHVHPAQVASELSLARIREVVSYIRPVLQRAIDARGATLADGGYQDFFGQDGEYYPYVYGNTGRPCTTCGTPIRRGVLGAGKSARSYHFCPRCQPMRRGKPRQQRR